MVKKIATVLVILPLLILLLAPKKEMVYLVEKQLATQGVRLGNAHIVPTLLGVTLEHPTLYVKGIPVATVQRLSLWTALVYTEIRIEGIHFDASLQAYLPKQIDRVRIKHSLLQPTRLPIAIDDAHHNGHGEVKLGERKLVIRMHTLPKDSPLKRYLKHTKEGWIYAKRF